MTDKTVPVYIKDNAQALRDYLSIRGLKDNEIERTFIRFEEFIVRRTLEKVRSGQVGSFQSDTDRYEGCQVGTLSENDKFINWPDYKSLTKHTFKGKYLGYVAAYHPGYVFVNIQGESDLIINARLATDELVDGDTLSNRDMIDRVVEIEVLVAKGSQFAILTSIKFEGEYGFTP